MKKIYLFTIQLVFSILISTSIWAQIPQGFSYQAVVRDAQGNIVQNHNVSFRFSLLENSASGTIVYAETQQTTTNNLGLVILTIGSGTVQQGNFTTIQWGDATHFLKVELDINGGSSYVNMGTTQLLSVPYALYAQKSISDTLWTLNGSNIYNNNAGHVGIGLTAPNGKVTIQGDTSNVLFEVRDRDGIPVFVIYQDSVQVFVNASAAKTNKGSFAINAKTQSKANPTTYLRVAPDSSRIYTESPTSGFGVRDLSSGSATSYMNLTPQNYFIGHNAGVANSVGLYNLFLGYESGKTSWAGNRNVLIGYRSGANSNYPNFNDNIFIGDSTGINNSSYSNIFIGNNAGQNNNAYENIYIGLNCGKFGISGQYNTFLGTNSGKISTGSLNTFIGNASGANNTSGQYNVFVGCDAGTNNNIGSFNTYVGEYSGGSSNYNNSASLGYNSPVNADNTVYLGNSSTLHIGGAVSFAPISDKRVKTNIKENVPGLAFINKLKPVTYNLDINKLSEFLGEDYKTDKNGNKVKIEVPEFIKKARLEKSKITYTGFLAQDVEKAAKEVGYDFSGIDKPASEQQLYGLRYDEFTVPMVKAIQELSQKVEEQQKIIEQLEKEIKELKK